MANLATRHLPWPLSPALLLAYLLAGCGAAPDPGASTWTMHTVDDSLEGADGVDLFDVDADGDMDAVVGWEESRALRLYFNPGGEAASEPWPAVDISGGLPIGKIEDARFADLDGDGQLDVVFTALEKGSERVAAHWLSDAQQPRQAASWRGTELDSPLAYRYIKLAVADIDGDGQADVVAGAKQDGKPGALTWMRSPAAAGPEASGAWGAQLIDELEWVDSLLLHDLDADGRRDVLVNHNGFMGWYRNPAAPGEPWQRSLVSEATGSYFARCPDLQGRLTLVAGADLSKHRAGDTVLHLVQQVSVSGDRWLTRPLTSRQAVPRDQDSSDFHVKGLACGALDDNPLPDVAVSISGAGVGVFLVMNLDLEGNTAAEVVPVATTARNSRKGIKFDDVRMVDLDRDGDLDLMTTEENGRGQGLFSRFGSPGLGVVWYENPQL